MLYLINMSGSALLSNLSPLTYGTFVKHKEPKNFRFFSRGLKPYQASKGVFPLTAFVGSLFNKNKKTEILILLWANSYYSTFLLLHPKDPSYLPRTYTLTHCDITSKITLSISQTMYLLHFLVVLFCLE